MTSSIMTSSSVPSHPTSDERREWIRIDDRVLMEWRVVTEAGNAGATNTREATPDVISAAVAKPTADLLARSGEALADSPVLPWIMKVDYLLEVILNALATTHPKSVAMAKPTNVNLSGGGVGFVSAQEIAAGAHLALKLILPPFTMIRALAKVIRAGPSAEGQGCMIATEFVDLKPDDQEHLIRHILHVQAQRLRAGRSQPG